MKSATFAERLSEAMQIREITQTELHRRTGINKSSINTYLKGGYKAKQDKVDILAEALNVSPVWLMGFDVPMNLSLIHISEPTRPRLISYAVFCLKKFFFNDTATTEIYTV